jgi:hypothetical protein
MFAPFRIMSSAKVLSVELEAKWIFLCQAVRLSGFFFVRP